jgi:diadenosine tetraphosphate (Ap4A) HIT family hydrolase
VTEDLGEQRGSGNDAEAGCVFCAIVAGTEPASVVYDDADVLAFLDINPITPGHLLVIAKRHARDLADLDEEDGARMYRVAARLTRALRASSLRCEGVNLFLADGEAAGQEVFHVHLHVFPRFTGDGFRIEADWSNLPTRSDLDATATRLRRAGARP